MKKPRAVIVAIFLVVAIIIVFIGILANRHLDQSKQNASSDTFVLADKPITEHTVQLCSPYANLCFTRPSDWTRSSSLHVAGTASNTVEINPPTGTILEFAKAGSDTNTRCDTETYKECTIEVTDVISLKNNLDVVTGMLIDNPKEDCSDKCASPKYMPFVTLVSQSDFMKYKLGSGTSSFSAFNPTVLVNGGRSIYMQVSPGKEFSIDTANQWLDSSEAKTAQQILSSAKVYR